MRGIRLTQMVLVGSAVVISGLLGLATNAASGQDEPWPRPLRWVQDNPWQSMIMLLGVTVVAAVVLEARTRSDRAEVRNTPALPQIADQLATAVDRQWQAEAQLRRLNDPHPLPVAWDPADLELIESWDNLCVTATGWPGGPPTGPAGWATSPAELAGADNDLADRLACIPTGRLLVFGDPGAGKTMLLIRLVLDLLERRTAGGPVPVLVPMAGWNPVEQDFPSWLAARLTVDHPGLIDPAPPDAGPVSRARALLDQRLLLPILDGFDELPEGALSRAVTRLNDWLPPRQGLVVASRSTTYRQAVTPTNPAASLPVRLWGAAGISLRPLAPDDVEAYLRRDAVAAARWDPVVASLGTGGPLAQTLTTPLLISLARTIYNPRPGEHIGMLPDPAELCDTTRFGTAAAIQEHLFDAFIPAAYRPHPDPRRRCPWTPEQAERWLVFLALHLEQDRQGTTDFAWWELRQAIPRSLLGLLAGLVVGLGLGLLVGLGLGLLAGLGVVLLVRFGLGAGLSAALMLGFEVWLAIWLEAGLVVGLGAGIGLGLGVGLRVGFSQASPIPARGVRWLPPRLAKLGAGLVVGPMVGLVVWLITDVEAALVIGLVAVLVFGLERIPADLTVAPDPHVGLARDRRTFWIIALVFGLVVGLVGLLIGLVGLFGLLIDLWVGLVGLVVALLGLCVGLVVVLIASVHRTAWGHFFLARCWLALRHRVPWRLMSFLADAHQQRGVLRQAGAVYQFRHADLQRRLATRPTS
jgi:hypothetical protein